MKATIFPQNKYITDDYDNPLHHRNVYAATLGDIPYGYHVHHVNCLKYDNRIENLIAVPKEFHQWLHKKPLSYVLLCRSGIVTKQLLINMLEGWRNKEFDLRILFKNVYFHYPSD